jgi:hypothetical protein
MVIMCRPFVMVSAGMARSFASASGPVPSMPYFLANARPRLVEEALRERRGQQRVHGHPAGGLAEDRDVVRVATEGRDVPAHPLQRRELVHQTVVRERTRTLLRGERRVREEAQMAQPVVEADEHDAPARECAAVVHRGRRAAVDEAAAVDPHHHGQARIGARGGRTPHVQIEAVFRGLLAERRGVAGKRLLRAVRPVVRRVARAAPRRRGLRRAPAQGTHGRRGEGHALEGRDPGVLRAAQRAGVDARLRRGLAQALFRGERGQQHQRDGRESHGLPPFCPAAA